MGPSELTANYDEEESGIAHRKIAVVVTSVHHGNTQLVAETMAEVLEADLISAASASKDAIAEYDCVAFGSGIYFGQHHWSIRQLVSTLENSHQPVMIFSTAGLPWLSRWFHWPLRRRLLKRGRCVLGEFSCRGWDTVGPLFLMGGINRRHPDAKDLKRARQFAVQMRERLGLQPIPEKMLADQ